MTENGLVFARERPAKKIAIIANADLLRFARRD